MLGVPSAQRGEEIGSGYITPAVSGVPNTQRGQETPAVSGAHMWVKWLPSTALNSPEQPPTTALSSLPVQRKSAVPSPTTTRVQ